MRERGNGADDTRFRSVPYKNFLIGCPEAAGFSGGLVLHKIVYPTKGLVNTVAVDWGICFFVDASQHRSTKHFPVWKTFSPHFQKVSTRNASRRRLSSVVRVNAAKMVQSLLPQNFSPRRHGAQRRNANSFHADLAECCGSVRKKKAIRVIDQGSSAARRAFSVKSVSPWCESRQNWRNQLASFILRVCLNAILPVRSS